MSTKPQAPWRLIAAAGFAVIAIGALGFAITRGRTPSAPKPLSGAGTALRPPDPGATATRAAVSPSTRAASPSSGVSGAAGVSYAPAAANAPASPGNAQQDLLRQCPFELEVGAPIRIAAAWQGRQFGCTMAIADPGVGQRGTLQGVFADDWGLAASGGQPLRASVSQVGSGRITQGSVRQESKRGAGVEDLGTINSAQYGMNGRFLWQDQPFEVLKGGQVIGRFQGTNEYQTARGRGTAPQSYARPRSASAAPAAPRAVQPSAARPELAACPFALRVGSGVRLTPTSTEPEIVFSQLDRRTSTVGEVSAGTWAIAGANRAALRLGLTDAGQSGSTLIAGTSRVGGSIIRNPGPMPFGRDYIWQDQPFEVYRGGSLVARFSNTAEFAAATGTR